jgi:hypothetical protein
MSTYRVTTRDGQGNDNTLRVDADKAEQAGGQLVLTKLDGTLVASFISVVEFVDESAIQTTP